MPNRSAARRLRENIALLGEASAAEVIQTDALRLLKTPRETPFDIVFLDPPFGEGLLPAVCGLLEENGWLSTDAMVYLEQDAKRPWPPAA